MEKKNSQTDILESLRRRAETAPLTEEDKKRVQWIEKNYATDNDLISAYGRLFADIGKRTPSRADQQISQEAR